jgi:integrator complex subunit 11
MLCPCRFPDFSLLPFQGRFTEMISAVLVTHFHLDHCAGLPYLTEVMQSDPYAIGISW